MKKYLFGLLFFLLIINNLQAQEASPPLHIELISEEQSVQPGRTFWVAVHLNIAKNYHTYWKNPGDAGLATSIEWTLPAGFTAGPLEWPYPQRFELNSLVGYGYEGEVFLLAPIQAPETLTQGTEVQVAAKVTWLVCDDSSCLPGDNVVSTKLPVSREAPQYNVSWKEAFSKARAMLPKKQWNLTAQQKDGLIQLHLRTPSSPAAYSDVDFFPDESTPIDHQVEAVLTQDPKSGDYLVVLREDASTKLSQLKGVVVLYAGTGVEALEVNVPLATPTIEEAVAVVEKPPAGPKIELSDAPINQFEGGLGLALVLGFVGGMILNLMPCVLPVISFKVLSFVKMAGESRTVTLKHGLAFSAGVILSFWVLASIMLLLQAYGRSVGWGFQLQEPLFVAILAAFLLVFGLSLFGVFELGASLTGYASQAQGGGNSALISSFLSGILATAVATPCTGPFLGTAIGFAVTLPPLSALMIFTSLGIGMASPYLVLALFPQLLRFLPKPGNWMVIFKELMGFLMVATVIWLLWVFGAQTSSLGVVFLLGAFFCLAMACWIFGKWATPVKSRSSKRISYALVAMLVLTSGYLIFNSTSPMVMAYESQGTAANPKTVWENYSEERIAELQQKGIPVLVDFTAKWCLICQANHMVLSTTQVSQKLDELGVVRMKADWTRNDENITRALRRFGRNGVPLYLLYGAKGEAPQILPQVLTPDNVLSHLDQVQKEIAEAK